MNRFSLNLSYKRKNNSNDHEPNGKQPKNQKTPPKKAVKTAAVPTTKATKIDGFCLLIGETEKVFKMNVNEHFKSFEKFFELSLKNFSCPTIKIQATCQAEYTTALEEIENTLCNTKYPLVFLVVMAQDNAGSDFTGFLSKLVKLDGFLPEVAVGVLPEADALLSKLNDQDAATLINYRKIAFNNFSDHARCNIITVSHWSDKHDARVKCTVTNRINRLCRKITKFEPERTTLLRVNTSAVAGKISFMSSKAVEMLKNE